MGGVFGGGGGGAKGMLAPAQIIGQIIGGGAGPPTPLFLRLWIPTIPV